MSVLIKGMEMPDSCYHCKIAECCGHYIANYTDRRQEDCPLVALPDHHGRLVDADVLFREMEKAQWYNNADRDEVAENLVLNAPTIEPERKKGEWIHDGHAFEGGIDWMHCSECGHKDSWSVATRTPFCGWCGARMEETNESD